MGTCVCVMLVCNRVVLVATCHLGRSRERCGRGRMRRRGIELRANAYPFSFPSGAAPAASPA
eukprot:666661-Prymnesium_polylepis.1